MSSIVGGPMSSCDGGATCPIYSSETGTGLSGTSPEEAKEQALKEHRARISAAHREAALAATEAQRQRVRAAEVSARAQTYRTHYPHDLAPLTTPLTFHTWSSLCNQPQGCWHVG